MSEEKVKKDAKKEEEIETSLVPADARIMWFEDKVCGAFKVKSDKFKKLISTGDNV